MMWVSVSWVPSILTHCLVPFCLFLLHCNFTTCHLRHARIIRGLLVLFVTLLHHLEVWKAAGCVRQTIINRQRILYAWRISLLDCLSQLTSGAAMSVTLKYTIKFRSQTRCHCIRQLKYCGFYIQIHWSHSIASDYLVTVWFAFVKNRSCDVR
jgi:hypothetical protein